MKTRGLTLSILFDAHRLPRFESIGSARVEHEILLLVAFFLLTRSIVTRSSRSKPERNWRPSLHPESPARSLRPDSLHQLHLGGRVHYDFSVKTAFCLFCGYRFHYFHTHIRGYEPVPARYQATSVFSTRMSIHPNRYGFSSTGDWFEVLFEYGCLLRAVPELTKGVQKRGISPEGVGCVFPPASRKGPLQSSI